MLAVRGYEVDRRICGEADEWKDSQLPSGIVVGWIFGIPGKG